MTEIDKMDEPELQNLIMLNLSKCGCHVYRSNAGKILTKEERYVRLFPKGFPDICGFRHSDGKFFCIEIKTPTGRLRKDQKKFGEMIKQYPVLYGVARSVEDALKIVGVEE